MRHKATRVQIYPIAGNGLYGYILSQVKPDMCMALLTSATGYIGTWAGAMTQELTLPAPPDVAKSQCVVSAGWVIMYKEK